MSVTEPLTTADLADRLDAHPETISRWAHRWHGPLGSGNHHKLTLTDLLVARAWQALTTDPRKYPLMRDLRRAAEAAIRRNPRRWLLVSNDRTATFDDETELLQAVSDSRMFARVIDLWSAPS